MIELKNAALSFLIFNFLFRKRLPNKKLKNNHFVVATPQGKNSRIRLQTLPGYNLCIVQIHCSGSSTRYLRRRRRLFVPCRWVSSSFTWSYAFIPRHTLSAKKFALLAKRCTSVALSLFVMKNKFRLNAKVSFNPFETWYGDKVLIIPGERVCTFFYSLFSNSIQGD